MNIYKYFSSLEGGDPKSTVSFREYKALTLFDNLPGVKIVVFPKTGIITTITYTGKNIFLAATLCFNSEYNVVSHCNHTFTIDKPDEIVYVNFIDGIPVSEDNITDIIAYLI